VKRLNAIKVISLTVISGLFGNNANVYADNIISVPAKKAVIVSQKNTHPRVCYYDDKAYSLGAVLEISGVVIQCAEQNDFETNGALSWKTLEKKDEQ
jgi:hypothetical protein